MKLQGMLLRSTPTIVWLIGVVIIWQIISWFLLNVAQVPLAQSKLPYIHELVKTFTEYSGTLLQQAFVTLKSASLGFFLGTLAGVVIAVVMMLT